MAKIDDAADQVLGLAERFRGLIDIAEVIKSIGSLDQAVAERQAALGVVTQEHEAAKAELAAAQIKIIALRDVQSDELAQHQKDCDAFSEKAAADATETLRQSKHAADMLMATTQEELRVIRQTHDGVIAEKRVSLADLESRVDAATQSLADITAAHDATSRRVEALRAAAKSVLGD